ncbi:MAG: hypothetical protein NVSMB2_07320 [Chloroflexota bacterium]
MGRPETFGDSWKHGFQPIGGVVQHGGKHVAVSVERQANLTVTEELHDDPGRDAGGQEVGGGAVAEIVGAVRQRETGLGEEFFKWW